MSLSTCSCRRANHSRRAASEGATIGRGPGALHATPRGDARLPDVAGSGGDRMTEDQAAGEIARLRLEVEHRDQLLASVHARADTLRASVERLERQLDAAAEEQREAATERAELRRLLGNAQLQVHALMQLPAPNAGTGVPADGGGGEPEPAPRPLAPAPPARAPAPRPVAPAPSARASAPRPAAPAPPAGASAPRPATTAPSAGTRAPRPAAPAPSAGTRAPRPAAAAPSTGARAPRRAGARPQAPPRRRSLLDDARGLLSGLRRMI